MPHDPIYLQFATHRLNTVGLDKAKVIAEIFSECLSQLEDTCGTLNNGREMAIVKTKLEEACFFAKKAMAIQANNQVEPTE